MSGLHHPSACDSVVLLLKILSASLYSMYLKVNPAYTSMCMYIQFAHSISSFLKLSFTLIFLKRVMIPLAFVKGLSHEILSSFSLSSRHPSVL